MSKAIMVSSTYCNGVRNYRVDVEQGGHVDFTVDGKKGGSARWTPRLGLYCIPPTIPRAIYVELEKKLLLAFRDAPSK